MQLAPYYIIMYSSLAIDARWREMPSSTCLYNQWSRVAIPLFSVFLCIVRYIGSVTYELVQRCTLLYCSESMFELIEMWH